MTLLLVVAVLWIVFAVIGIALAVSSARQSRDRSEAHPLRTEGDERPAA